MPRHVQPVLEHRSQQSLLQAPPRAAVVLAWSAAILAAAVVATGVVPHAGAALYMLGATALVWWLRRRLDLTILQLSDAGRTDPLTGLLNRGALQDAAGTEIRRSLRSGAPVALVVADLDRFKLVNDTHGHDVGDEVLRRFAALLRDHTRDGDLAARLGGEAFALLLPATAAEEAIVVAERLRATARTISPVGLVVSVSVGIAVAPADGASHGALLHNADRALYAAKHLGRDRVVRFDTHATEELLAAARAGDPGRREALVLLAESLDLRDPSTAAHSRTVGGWASAIGRGLGLGAGHVERIRLAGVLHDIGKLSIPDTLLLKPGPLSEAEVAVIRRHPELGARLLEGAGLDDISDWVRCHHERPDGLGYPRGLRGDEVCLEARILAVADSYEAMTSDRPYRSALPVEVALAELERHAGTQFDARIVAVLTRAVRAGAAALP